MSVNPRVNADLKKVRANQDRLRHDINEVEKKMVRMNNIDRPKRPVGFAETMKDLVSAKKQLEKELSAEAQKGQRLNRVLYMEEEEQPTEKTMAMIKRGGEPTRGYLEERHKVVVPGKHYALPMPSKSEAVARSHLEHTTSHRMHPEHRGSSLADMFDMVLNVGNKK